MSWLLSVKSVFSFRHNFTNVALSSSCISWSFSENSDIGIGVSSSKPRHDSKLSSLCINRTKRLKYFNALIGVVPSDPLTNFQWFARDFTFDFLSAAVKGTFPLSFFCIVFHTSIVSSGFTLSPFLLMKRVEKETRSCLGVCSWNGFMSSNQMLIAYMALSCANLWPFTRSRCIILQAFLVDN